MCSFSGATCTSRDVTMQISFLTRKSALIYRRDLRQRVASLTLNCNGVLAIRAYEPFTGAASLSIQYGESVNMANVVAMALNRCIICDANCKYGDWESKCNSCTCYTNNHCACSRAAINDLAFDPTRSGLPCDAKQLWDLCRYSNGCTCEAKINSCMYDAKCNDFTCAL